MTNHVRASLRAVVLTALLGITRVDRHVYATRRIPIPPENLPAILIYTLAEDSVAETMSGPRYLSRNLDLVIEAVAQDTNQLDDTLDALAVEIETRLGTALSDPNSPLRALARAGTLVRTEIGLRPPQAQDEAGTGHIVLTYRVNYRTRSDNPQTTT